MRQWLVVALVTGLALGLATLTRPVVAPLALLVSVWFLFRLSLVQTVLRLFPVAAVAALALVPWVARNYGVYGEFVAMSLTAGTNFYQGNHPDVVPYMRAGYDVQWIGPESQQHDPYSPAGDRERFNMALDYLRAHPDAIPELVWVKLQAHWSIDIFPRRNPDEGNRALHEYQGDAQAQRDADGNLILGGVPEGDPVAAYDSNPTFGLGRLLHRLYFGVLLVLALAGVTLSWRGWREVSLLWFVQLSMTFVYVVFHPSTRYRVPTDPLLFLFSAYAVAWLWGWARERLHNRAAPFAPANSSPPA
jgi:4-amino-4-deoxy-L-arabinose transferase-like glycosyltransferase